MTGSSRRRSFARRRRLPLIAAALVTVIAVIGLTVTRSSGPKSFSSGYDVSWPQCSGTSTAHMPPGRPEWLIVGLSRGSGHSVNPCLRAQLDWARSHGARVGAYAVPSYPTPAEQRAADTGEFGQCHGKLACRLRNDGAQQASNALRTLTAVGLAVPLLWLDVETRTTEPWTVSTVSNRRVIAGAFSFLRRSHVRFGVYTTGYMWHHIVGDYRLRVPNWLPSGDAVRAHAAALCGTTATGGTTWLAQYTRYVDADLACRTTALLRAGSRQALLNRFLAA